MKKTAALALLAFAPLLASADTITNYVYVVSNLYFREVREITNNVKNTHFNYYYTNNVSTVQNVYQVTYKTNVTVNVDLANEAIARAAAEADRAERAEDNAASSADDAAASATAAGQAASRAASSATSAATSAQNAANAANNGLNAINARINWFDQHSGETITQNNYYWTTNLYFAEDSTARAGVASNAAAIASLENRVGDNIGTLQSQVAAANGRISANETAISTANGRISANATAIASLENRVGDNIGTLQGQVNNLGDRIGDIEACFNPGDMTYSTQVVYRCDSIPDWSFRLDSSVFTSSAGGRSLTLLDENRPSSIGRDEILAFIWYPRNYNYGIQINYYVGGSTGYKTINEYYVFPDTFAVGSYTFRKHGEKFIPSASGSNVVVRAVSLFGDSYNPKKTEGQMLADEIGRQTADLSRRVDALESDDTDMPESIGMYTRHRPSVTYSYYYTYGGNKLLYRVKVYTDRATVVSSSGTSTTYGYDFEVLYTDSSIGNMGEVSYVQKIIYPADPANNEIVTRLYRNGWSFYNLRGFTDDIHDLKGGASVGDRLTCYSNTLGYFVMQLDAVDSSQAKELQYYVAADFNVYNASGTKIGRVMRDTDWTSLSNWVERVFQKK